MQPARRRERTGPTRGRLAKGTRDSCHGAPAAEFESHQQHTAFFADTARRSVRYMSGTRFATVMIQFVPASFVVGAGMELFMLNTVSAQSRLHP